jgi:hypothetical protein
VPLGAAVPRRCRRRLGSLLSTRLVSGVLGLDSAAVDDDALVPAWVDMVVATLSLPASGSSPLPP